MEIAADTRTNILPPESSATVVSYIDLVFPHTEFSTRLAQSMDSPNPDLVMNSNDCNETSKMRSVLRSEAPLRKVNHDATRVTWGEHYPPKTKQYVVIKKNER